MSQNSQYENKQQRSLQEVKNSNENYSVQSKPSHQKNQPHLSSENQKWQKIIQQNGKQDEEIPFLMQQKSFQSQNKNQDYERQKSMMQQAAKNGRQYLINKNYQQASKQLSKTLMAFQFIAKNYAQTIPKEYLKQMMIQTVLPAYNNLSLCYLKLKNYEMVVSFTNQVIGQDPSNVKARYRRGLAYKQLKNINEAISDFQFVKKLDPQMESDCLQKILQCRKIEAQQRKRTKLAAQKFISGYESQTRKTEQTSKSKIQSTKQEQNVQKNEEKSIKIEQKDQERHGILNWIKRKCQQCTEMFSKVKRSEKKQQ